MVILKPGIFKSIEFFEDLFGIPYPLPKCDFLSTDDHSAAAMENWGLMRVPNSFSFYMPLL